MNTQMLIAVVVSMFVCQQVHAQGEDDPPQAEATELEGTWELVSVVVAGEQDDVPEGFQLRFEGHRCYRRDDNDTDWNLFFTFSVAPSTMPVEFDLENGDEPNLGIYEIDGDSLTFCYGENGKARPERFESTEDYPSFLLVLRRAEEDE